MTFMDLENPDHAYLFGFLQADGHLYRGRGQKGRLTVELNARDMGLLERFKELCPYPSSITTRTRTTNFSAESHTAVWTVCALEFRRELIALGLPEGRKSLRTAPPDVTFSARDYLRGVIDADGSLGTTAQGFPFVSLATQSDAMADYFSTTVRQVTGVLHKPRRNRRDSIYNLYYEREPAVELSRHLYPSDCLALMRKQGTADRLQAWKRPAGMKRVPNRKIWMPEEDRILLRAPSIQEACHLLDRSPASCNLRLWRLKKLQTPQLNP